MDLIPNSAVVMAIGLLILILAFLAHMMMSKANDARLRFLLTLFEEDEQFSNSSPQQPSPRLSDADPKKMSRGASRTAAEAAPMQLLQHVWREVPTMFTMSLRGRGM